MFAIDASATRTRNTGSMQTAPRHRSIGSKPSALEERRIEFDSPFHLASETPFGPGHNSLDTNQTAVFRFQMQLDSLIAFASSAPWSFDRFCPRSVQWLRPTLDAIDPGKSREEELRSHRSFRACFIVG